MEPDRYRRAALDNWAAMAPGWERRRAEMEEAAAPVREWLIRALAPQLGDTVLELAAGPGETGFEAAALVGDSGRLISSDMTPAMVDVARRRADELGLRNVEHRVLDAERMELEDDSVDGVLCRWGYMLMPDPAAALSETRRVLRPGGRLALAVWSGPERNPWVSLAGRMLVERGHVTPSDPGGPGMFTMSSEERTQGLLVAAGFDEVRSEEVPVLFVNSSIDAYVSQARDTGGVFSTAFRDASEDERRAMTAQLTDAFAPFKIADRYELPGVALCAVAS